MNELNRDDRSEPWSDLTIALLSVNNFPLTKAFALFDSLKKEGLFDPKTLADSTPEQIAQKLTRAGYERGPGMTAIFTERLVSLGRLFGETPDAACANILRNGSREEVCRLLSSVKGVGPKVLENFFVLRGDR